MRSSSCDACLSSGLHPEARRAHEVNGVRACAAVAVSALQRGSEVRLEVTDVF